MIIGNTYSDGSVKWKVTSYGSKTNTSNTGTGGGGSGSTTLYTNAPVGTIIPYIVNNDLPNGYLICNGAEVLREDYPELFNKIGTGYGVGDGETTFNLPDLRDLFLQGGETAGIEKEAGLPNIKGSAILANDGTTSAIVINGYDAFASTANSDSAPSTRPSASSSTRYKYLNFDASDSNQIYSDDVDTVQPPALTVVYLIKAYQSAQIVDVVDTSKLSVSYKDTFTYIYPNNGTESNPANVTTNTRYVEANPFPGYIVQCKIELYYNNEWGTTNWATYNNGITNASTYCVDGITCTQHNNDYIDITTGKSALFESGYKHMLNGFSWSASDVTDSPTTLPCRIKVWKVGRLNSNVPDIQEVMINQVVEKPNMVTTVTYEDTYAIIYPNDGTEESPADVTTNSNYVSNNPFPGYYVNCVAEVYYDNHWGTSEWLSGYSGGWMSYGTKANQFDDDYIVTQTGIYSTVSQSRFTGNPFQNIDIPNQSTTPCRVKVWKVGKIADSNVPDLQEVSVHNTITVDEDTYSKNNWCYIYPNEGTEENPANVTTNSTYILENPFPGYAVECKVEIYWHNEWGSQQWCQAYINGYNTWGSVATQHNNDQICYITGTNMLIGGTPYRNSMHAMTWPTVTDTDGTATAPCRIKVWKVGKIHSS